MGDGAEVGTAQAVSASNDPRVRFFDLPKAPYFGYANRNIAMREARGRFVAFASDDDLLFPDHLSTLAQCLSGEAVIACTRAAWVSSDGTAAPVPTSLALPDEARDFTQHRNVLPAACWAYRRDAIEGHKHWPEDVDSAADWALWRRLISAFPDRPLVANPTYSVLHFSAPRHGSRHARMSDFKVLLDIADKSAWWPQLLKPAIPPQMTEQSIWLALLGAPGPQKVRAALQQVTDRLAWENIQAHFPPNMRRLSLSSLDANAITAQNTLPPGFDSETYLRLNPDVAKAGMAAAQHWLNHGQFEGRPYKL